METWCCRSATVSSKVKTRDSGCRKDSAGLLKALKTTSIGLESSASLEAARRSRRCGSQQRSWWSSTCKRIESQPKSPCVELARRCEKACSIGSTRGARARIIVGNDTLKSGAALTARRSRLTLASSMRTARVTYSVRVANVLAAFSLVYCIVLRSGSVGRVFLRAMQPHSL